MGILNLNWRHRKGDISNRTDRKLSIDQCLQRTLSRSSQTAVLLLRPDAGYNQDENRNCGLKK